MKLCDLVKKAKIPVTQIIPQDIEVGGISCNSKTVCPGDLFVAIKGVCNDGSRFVREALHRKAKVIISENAMPKVFNERGVLWVRVADARHSLSHLASVFYKDPSAGLKVIGVTGTNGKTSVTYLLESVLKKANLPSGVIGTINYRFPRYCRTAKNTTPGPLELLSLLSAMKKAGVRYVAMEVSSHALSQKRTEGITFSSAIFTNLTQDHLDYHLRLKNYFEAKALLFEGLSSKASAMVNSDDAYCKKLKAITKARVVTYGIKSRAEVTAKEIVLGRQGTQFLLVHRTRRFHLHTRLIGIHNVYNILAAAAWALQEKIPVWSIQEGIAHCGVIPGRLEPILCRQGFSVFVDYAHTEDALKNVLMTLRQLPRRRIIVVFGCGGERDSVKRPRMGRVVSRLSDYAFVTNDNPRSEDPLKIIADIRRGMRGKEYEIIPDRLKAIKKSLTIARGGDIVLIAGKGHEPYQVIGSTMRLFDDREVVRKCLRSRN
ncbi:MAG: UDP-N-acetylmuramoyl-L-alanyl-D-glutamate--2,6-diaminopimelate ligase [Candidatus Omnitrophica bacterium]|nr:UDP-N-acetylmuramoyl-L-alanyl-D-glutamate--2,6-diaminopimelate ligase [Candidatus Omnitrophota bacterium]